MVKLVLPQDKPLMHIDSFKDFCTICLFPFLSLIKEGNKCYKIEIEGSPKSLLDEFNFFELNGETFNMTLLHIQEYTCRVLIN
jgi:hypothetical protein